MTRITFKFLLSLTIILSLNIQAQSLSGDAIPTDNGNLIIHPIDHATFAMGWDGKTIYIDPVGGAEAFSSLPAPDMIIITDIHGDHLNQDTLTAVAQADTQIIAPTAVIEQLPDNLKAQATQVNNDQLIQMQGISIEGIPMYNLTEDRLQFHEKGRGNGYVMNFGGTRIYISGDTEDIPEMRALDNIDVAFVCFNLPYTMTEQQAADAVNAFRPDIVYPYHYRGSDLELFTSLVNDGIEVREGAWY